MNKPITFAVLLAGILFSLTKFADADDAPPLVHNPFARPSSEVAAIDRRSLASGEVTSNTITLTATLVGVKNKLANIDGRVIRQGEEIDGYRLVEVHEDHAVFIRAGNKLTVYVKPDLVESDE